MDPPPHSSIEGISTLAFTTMGRDVSEKLPVQSFLEYCTANPTAVSWVSHYDDIPDKTDAAEPPTEPYVHTTFPARDPEHLRKWSHVPQLTEEETPWLSQEQCEELKPASKVKSLGTAPDATLTPEWVYGVSTCSTSLTHYLPDGSIAYEHSSSFL